MRRHRIFDERAPYIDRFGLLLLLTVGSVVTLALVGENRQNQTIGSYLQALLMTVVVGFTLVVALRASGVARRWTRLADLIVGGIVVVTVALICLDLFTGGVQAGHDPVRQGFGPFVWLVLAAFSPVVVLRRLVRQQQVSKQTLYGTVSAYLLIPITYYYLFIVVDMLQDGFFTESVDTTPPFMYFSLTTISTLGYGDLTPHSDLARFLSTSEAVVGQVFLVTFVALVVSRFAASWQPRSAPSAPSARTGPAAEKQPAPTQAPGLDRDDPVEFDDPDGNRSPG